MPYALRTTGALIVVMALGIALAATVAASALSALVVVMASGRPQPRLRRIARAGQTVARQLTRGGSVALVAVVG